jgi:hypothetical protein
VFGLGSKVEVCSAAVADAYAAVAEVRVGNAFTNANKALAHVMAYGRDTLTAPPPRLCGASLERHGLLPQHGYLQEQAPS